LKSDNGIRIRLASADDAEQVHSLIVELAEAIGELHRVSSSVDDFRGALSGPDPAIHAFLVERNLERIGLAIFFLSFSTWRGKWGVYLQDIYIRADSRGTGAGKVLLANVAAWGIERGADHLRLSVDRDNTPARSFYEKIGMTFCSKEMIYQISDDEFNQLGSGS
jgi:ribosomal protein S18 acetylase RimI-like enzyme